MQTTDPSTTLADSVLTGLDPEQREVATALHGPVCVLAGAGTGKTRALTHRIAYGVHSGAFAAQQVLAVTFTARAAAELRARLRDLGVPGVQARTFHAAALRQLQFFWPQAVGGPIPQLVEQKARLVAEAASRMRLRVDRASVRDLSAEIEWSKVSMLTPETYLTRARETGRGTPGGLDVDAVARLIQAYEDVKTDRGAMDFEDVLLLTVGILDERGDVAERVRGQYRTFTVDEYQDVSALQKRLLDLWTGGRDDLCVVGDASQTIYSFTGASPQHLLDFPKEHPSAKIVRLVRDYRSTPQVVGLANGVLDRAPASATRARVQLVSQREAGPSPSFTSYDDDVAESAGIAARIQKLMEAGTPASEIAVLYRTNGQSEPLEQALSEAGIGYLLKGGQRFFARPEVRKAVVLLRGAQRSDDGSTPLGAVVRDVIASAGWSAEPPAAAGAVRERWASLQALAALADDIAEARPEARLPDLVAEIDERDAAQHAPSVEGVTLASLHAAKGLEWDAVFLTGLTEGLMPISFSQDDPAAVEEERRLLYVGVTRARVHLALSWARARTPGGRGNRNPSRFLDGLRPGESAPARGAGAPTPKRSRGRAQAKACRSCGKLLATGAERKVGRCEDCPPTYDEAVFERLREWRSGVAAEAKVPAYVVFTDATLVAVAELGPTSATSLATVAGVGPTKLERYGEAVLKVLAGE